MIVRALRSLAAAFEGFGVVLLLLATRAERVGEVRLVAKVSGVLRVGVAAVAAVLGAAAADRTVRVGAQRLRDVRVRGVRGEQVRRARCAATVLGAAVLVHTHRVLLR